MEAKVALWLERMPLNVRYKVDARQIELIKEWIGDADYDKGIHFSEDWSEVYKTDINFKQNGKVQQS